MPNINAAIGFAQMERIDYIIENKRENGTALCRMGANNMGCTSFMKCARRIQTTGLNAMVVTDRAEREEFLAYSNANGVQTRPIWVLMSKLPMYKDSFAGPLENSLWLEDRIVNVPSSVRV